MSQDHNGHTWPVTINVTNDRNAHQVTFRFVTETVDVECVYDDVFDAHTALKATISPDVSTLDDMQIYSVNVHSISYVISDPTTEPTEDPSYSPTPEPTDASGRGHPQPPPHPKNPPPKTAPKKAASPCPKTSLVALIPSSTP